MSAIGVTIANLDKAQITLNALFLEHSFSTQEEFISRLSKHYYMQVIREVFFYLVFRKKNYIIKFSYIK